jgi:hypothetical protein
MARLRDTAFPLANYPTGSQTVGPFNLRNQDRAFRLTIRRCTTADPTIWPNASTLLRLAAEISFDGGTTWKKAGAMETRGGIVSLGGEELTESWFQVNLPPGDARRLRANVTIVDGPLRSEGFLDMIDDQP